MVGIFWRGLLKLANDRLWFSPMMGCDSFSLLLSSLLHSNFVSPSLTPTPCFSRCEVVACLGWISAWQGHGSGVFFCKVTAWWDLWVVVEVDEARQRRVVAELGVAYQMWVMAEVGFFCVNFDLNFFFFFGGSSFGFEFCYWFVLILGWIFFVGSWWWRWRIAVVMVVAWPWVSMVEVFGFQWPWVCGWGFSIFKKTTLWIGILRGSFYMSLKMTLVFNW